MSDQKTVETQVENNSAPLSGFLQIYSTLNDGMNIQNTASVYNTADGFETNPDIIRSEMMFYTTPSTEKYMDVAYDSLVNIQNQCAYDYQNYCLNVQSEQMSLNDVMNQMFSFSFPTNSFSFQRKLNSMEVIANDSVFKSGAEYVNYIRTLITNKINFLSFMKNPYTSAVFRPSEKENKDINTIPENVKNLSLGNKLKLFRNSKLSDIQKKNVPRIYSNYHIQNEANPLSSTQERHLSNGLPTKIAHMRPAPEWGTADEIKRALLLKTPAHNNEQRRAAPGWVNPTATTRAAAGNIATRNVVDTSHINPILGPTKIAHMRPAAPEWDRNNVNAVKHTSLSPAHDNNEQRRAAPGWVNPASTIADASSLNQIQKRRIAEENIINETQITDDYVSPISSTSPSNKDSKVGCGGSKKSDYGNALLIENDVDKDDNLFYYYQQDDNDDADVLDMWIMSPFNNNLVPQQFNSDRLASNADTIPAAAGGSVKDSSHHHQDWHHHDHQDWHHHGSSFGSSSSIGSSSEGFSDEHSWWGLPPHPPPPPPPPSSEDLTFAGILGFGAEGDMCLYRNMDQVSPPCVSAVSDFYQLRKEYWDEYQHQQSPCYGKFGLIVAALLCITLLVRRYFGNKRRQQVRSLLTALHTHPELKATVEAETGLKVPMPVPDSCCNASSTTTTSSCPLNKCKGFVIRTLKVLVFLTFLFISSLFITISSLELTMVIVQQMDNVAQENPVTGELDLTSPLAALCILFAIVCMQVSLFVMAIRAIKKCCPCPYKKNNTTTTVPTAAAPSAPPTYEDQGGGGGQSLMNSAQYYFITLPASLFTTISSSSSQSLQHRLSDAYTPLLTNDDRVEELHSSEMISISTKPPQSHHSNTNSSNRVTVALTPSHTNNTASATTTRVTMIPITAHPVNSISMI